MKTKHFSNIVDWQFIRNIINVALKRSFIWHNVFLTFSHAVIFLQHCWAIEVIHDCVDEATILALSYTTTIVCLGAHVLECNPWNFIEMIQEHNELHLANLKIR